jgi:urocanate reductase
VLEATISKYDAAGAKGKDAEFGKDAPHLQRFEGDLYYTVELCPGIAKAYGGVALDAGARVLGQDGQPIAGLYAAGEVAGMLGTSAIGQGFAGTMTACFFTGGLAGKTAASEI